jgi:hypothetical protein
VFAPDRDFAENAAAYQVAPGSPALSALTSALSALVTISDEVTLAVQNHDRLALISRNERAEGLIEEVNGIGGTLTDADRSMLADAGVPALVARLSAGARRNAFLIEQAWAVDAALIRLLMGVGRIGPDGTVGGYSANPGPACVNRDA